MTGHINNFPIDNEQDADELLVLDVKELTRYGVYTEVSGDDIALMKGDYLG